MYPYDFKPQRDGINFREIFVVMPFAAQYDSIYDDLIDPAVKRANQLLGYSTEQTLYAYRSKDDTRTYAGWVNVLERLSTAGFVLGVLTDDNPNVFYELGIAHATQPITRQILIVNKGYEPRFDLKDLIHYSYEDRFAMSVEPLAHKIKDAVESHQMETERKIKRARMLVGLYDFEVIMIHGGKPNFGMHTSKQGRIDYENLIKQSHGEEFASGSFERHAVAISNLCRSGLLGLNTHSKINEGQTVVEFSYFWTDLGNCVLNLLGLISKEDLKKRRRTLPEHFY